ncbi:MAG: hypothetical protein NZ528_14890 [Caldilineales bacterium]|nr:hypothetical protein [Caldilineales bacterium]MDW8317471.1 hypothetical protein [Anaerolineae bacterium]
MSFSLVQIVVGAVLLLQGRRLFWLLAGSAGFVLGLFLANRLLRDQSGTTVLLVALFFGVVGAVLAVVAQKALIGLVGFLAGGIGLLALVQALGFEPTALVQALVVVVGGVVGAYLLSAVFELGLIVLSSLIGANLLMGGLSGVFDITGQVVGIASLVAFGLGVAVQARSR